MLLSEALLLEVPNGLAPESAAVEASEDAANHPERPAQTHEEYGRPDDVPPQAATQS